MDNLPNDVQFEILTVLASSIHKDMNVQVSTQNLMKKTQEICSIFTTISLISKGMHELVQPFWTSSFEVFHSCRSNHCRETDLAKAKIDDGSLTTCRALSLVSGTGCEICETGGIRKVYWPFGLRCCRPCLENLTVSDYRIRNDYGLGDSDFEHLPKVSSQLWASHVGCYTLEFYLTYSIFEVFQANVIFDVDYADTDAASVYKILAQMQRFEQFTAIVQGIRKTMREYKLRRFETARTKALIPTRIHYFMDNVREFGGSYPITEKELLAFANQPIDCADDVRKIYHNVAMKKLDTNVRKWVRDISLAGSDSDLCAVTKICIAEVAACFDMNEDSKRDKKWFMDKIWNAFGMKLLEDMISATEREKAEKQELD